MLKYLRNHHACLAALEESRIPRPPLPCETRWNTLQDALLYFKNHWGRLNDVISKFQETTGTERAIASDPVLRNIVNDILSVLEPISRTLDFLQSDNAKISDAWNEIFKLSQVFRLLQ